MVRKFTIIWFLNYQTLKKITLFFYHNLKFMENLHKNLIIFYLLMMFGNFPGSYFELQHMTLNNLHKIYGDMRELRSSLGIPHPSSHVIKMGIFNIQL